MSLLPKDEAELIRLKMQMEIIRTDLPIDDDYDTTVYHH